ncbi:MAG: hypothetical protein O3B37_13870 [Proteobacteria bacterium]|nr:hypothetical protein [Pseudomonadota bacterium]
MTRNTGATRRPHGSIRVNKAKREAFLNMLAETASVTAASQGTGVYRVKWYRIRKTDPAFAQAWDEALEIGLDAVEDEAIRRAVAGHEEPIYFRGEKIGAVTKYSDRMLMQLLQARRPTRYGAAAARVETDDLRSLLREIDGGDGPHDTSPEVPRGFAQGGARPGAGRQK